MENLNDYLQKMLAASASELRLVPNQNPYVVSDTGETEVAPAPVAGTQISTMIFPLIPADVKQELPNKREVEFKHANRLGKFSFHVKKSPAGFNVTIRPLAPEEPPAPIENPSFAAPDFPPVNFADEAGEFPAAAADENLSFASDENVSFDFENLPSAPAGAEIVGSMIYTAPEEIALDESANDFTNTKPFSIFQNHPPPAAAPPTIAAPIVNRPKSNPQARARMDKLFVKMLETEASHLHLAATVPPLARKNGNLQPLDESTAELTAETIKELLSSIMPAENLDEFANRRDTDFTYEVSGAARFRAHIFTDRHGMGGVFRLLPSEIPTAEQLDLSREILNLCDLSQGLIIVAGATGTGKSATLAAMIDLINKEREAHIITIEDPIEFVHENKKCLVNQREVRSHSDSFQDALRAALREDPDVLLVGKMRDLETISLALEAAENECIVLGELCAPTAASAIDRIIDQFRADRRQQIRVLLSESLKAVIAQTPSSPKDGGRVHAREVLIVTPEISGLIREGKTSQIPSAKI